MQKDHPLFEDMSRFASSLAGGAMEMKREIMAQMAAHIDGLADRMQLVSREEFEATKAMATKARQENELLSARLDALQAQIEMLTSGG